MRLCLLCFLGVLVFLGAADEVTVDVDHLPIAAYDCEPLEIVLRSPVLGGSSGWRLAATPSRVQIERREKDSVFFVRMPLVDPGLDDVRIIDAQGQTLKRIMLVRPGHNLRLRNDERGLLRSGDDPVILVLARREARADRRWALLRHLFRRTPELCSLVLEAPESSWGTSPLLAQIAALQRVSVVGEGVVLVLDGRDVEVGWKHRDYRKVLAWLVEDLRQRGSRRVVVVDPVAVADDVEALRPLREQVNDVVRTYRIEMVAQPDLSDRRFWEVEPGIIDRRLNPAGRRLFQSRYAPVLRARH